MFRRNRTVGVRLGKGEKLEDIQNSMSAVAEGILTSKSAHHLAEKFGVECHIIEGIYKVSLQKYKYPWDSFSDNMSIFLVQVIHEGADPLEIVASNMSRPLKPEVSPIISEAYLHH